MAAAQNSTWAFPQGAGKNKDQGLLSSSGQSRERDIFIKQTNQPSRKPQGATECVESHRSGFHCPCSVHGSDVEIRIWEWFGDKKMLWGMENSRELPFPGPEGVGHPAPTAPYESVQSFPSNRH